MLAAPLLAPSEVRTFTFSAVLDVRPLMKMLFGTQVPDRTLQFGAIILLEDYGRLAVQLETTSVIPGDREHEWLFAAIIQEINPDTHTIPYVAHSFEVGQRVRGILRLMGGGHDQGVLYVIQSTPTR